jgi:hypothetical protein
MAGNIDVFLNRNVGSVPYSSVIITHLQRKFAGQHIAECNS